MSIVVSARNLGKCYRVQGTVGRNMQYGYHTLRDDLVHWLTLPLRLFGSAGMSVSQDFWALKDVAFDIQRGDVVGFIGHNGAGKSTLLKILSRITKPTVGNVELRGRVGSLLEVGTGFHPELTGRENIFLNGAILGMPPARNPQEVRPDCRIRRDQSIPRYPGQALFERHVRAPRLRRRAHLEPEILIVDEVLAVGDL